MTITLTADCSRCAALCCLGLAMDKGEDFAIDKPAGLPCPNLDGHLCRIHKTLEWEGFAGCVRYDCAGAGQRVVQDVFAGASWQTEPELARPMIDAFRAMRLIHDLMQLLMAAEALSLPDAEEERRYALLDTLEREDWTPETLAAFETGSIPGEVQSFIRSLRAFVPARAPRG